MAERSLFEIALFLIVLGGSAWLFWRRLARVLATIRSSKPEPASARGNTGRTLLEVLFQTRVIAGRPWVGLAHALVFWGFCSFSLVTVNHLLDGFGLAWLRPDEGTFGPAYFFTALLFAVLVLLAISALTARRFLWQPKWLGASPSFESGHIALLIAALMVTYVLEYVWLPARHTAFGRALWWSHTLALAALLPLIPHTKHLHLLLGPVSLLLRRPGFSQIPPLDGDEDFGLHSGKDLTQLTALQAFSCVECGRCMEHCPAQATGKLLNPKQIALGVRSYLNEHGPLAEAPLLGVHLSEQAVFQCTTCGACESICPVGVQHLPILVGLRRGAVNTGAWEDDHGAQLFHRLERQGNPLGSSPIERDRFIQRAALPLFDGSQDYCLWLGCMGSYDPRGREAVLALAKLLNHLGLSFGVLKKEKCTGDSARRLGNDLAFQQLAEFNLAQFKSAGVKRLLSLCPHCVRTLGTDYREFGVNLEVEHYTTLLARHAARLPAGSEDLVFHDPCYLSRYASETAAPRALARRAGTLHEAPRHSEKSFCCGAGGGLVFLGEEQGDRIAHLRARELAATGAQTVATACPFCQTMLTDALTATGSPQQPRDLAEILAARLPGPPA